MLSKHIKLFLSVILLLSAPAMSDLQQVKADTAARYSTGVASEESTETSIAASMIGWGIAITIAIAVTFAILKHDPTTATTTSAP